VFLGSCDWSLTCNFSFKTQAALATEGFSSVSANITVASLRVEVYVSYKTFTDWTVVAE
jgi:hypothetical protein